MKDHTHPLLNKNLTLVTAVAAAGLWLLAAAEGPPAGLHQALEPLRPLLGKTFSGPFRDSTPEKPVRDVMKWERILNGQAVRVLHSINQGDYGGETIIRWNAKAERVEYYYFTTAGFMTQGTMTLAGNKITSHENVTGNENGVTEVKAATELRPDGGIHTKSMYLKAGQWVDGHEVTYQEAPSATVQFR
jgi:hypothetical protein